jgi:vacuolar iron transporter family protein
MSSAGDLQAQHETSRIVARLAAARKQSYLGDAVLGAVDGCVTTFAVVAGATGAALPAGVALVLGFANLAADGFSMAASNYQRARSEHEILAHARAMEEMHVEQVPDGEREEVRQIYAAKGFQGELLERIVQGITQDSRLWVDCMLTDELGLRLDPPQPRVAALTTFAGFCAAGALPLLPYALPGLPAARVFVASAVLAALVFFCIGAVKGKLLMRSPWRGGMETLLLGGAAATLAYLVGTLLQRLVA